MYAVLRKKNNSMVKKGLILGFALMIPHFVITMAVNNTDSNIETSVIDCEFLGYQVDTYRNTLQLSALVGDIEGMQEYRELQKKYNENCN